MKRLYFIRSKTTWEAEGYYESKTDAIVIGDVAGYDYLRNSILKARSSRQSIDLSEIPRRSYSMRVILVPSPSSDSRAARLKIIERIVFRTASPEMEVVLHANRKGYERLAQILSSLLDKSVGRLHDHEHVDDLFSRWVVKRSISLNVRGPVARWSRKAVAAYANVIFETGENYLPDDIGYLTRHDCPYETPDTASPFLKLS